MGGAVQVVGVFAALSLLAQAVAQAPAPSSAAPQPSAVAAAPAGGVHLSALFPNDVLATIGTGSTQTPTPPRTHTPASSARPDASAPNCARLKCVALTVDDGPVPQTATVLALLRKEHVHATFFVLGENAKRHPALVRRMVADGNAVGNHSWDHPQFWRLSKRSIEHQLSRTDALLKRLTGARPSIVRAPYGEIDARVRAVTRSRRQALIQWNVDPVDWRDRNTRVVTARVLKQVRRNSIVLTHDIRPTTRHAYAGIIRGLKAKGYTLVTVPELLAGRARPGRTYSHG